jgi:hypothetical protein
VLEDQQLLFTGTALLPLLETGLLCTAKTPN